MTTGFYYAIVTAIAFALSQVIIRRVTYRSGESFSALAVTVLAGAPLLPILITVTGQWRAFLSFSPVQYLLLASAGLVHLILARFLFFTATRVIGANPSVAISRVSIVFSVMLGVVFLGESVTPWLVFGAVVIMVGAVMTTVDFHNSSIHFSAVGLLLGLGVAIASSVSAALIRPVMEVTDSVFAAAGVMYLSAFAGVVVLLAISSRLRKQLAVQERRSQWLFVISAIILVAGHLSRFKALEDTPVSIVQPLIATMVIFVLAFSWIINRKIDIFNWRVITGIILVLTGVVILYI